MSPPEQLLKDLRAANAPSDFNRALQKLHVAFDAKNDELKRRHEVTLACKEGCFLCCFLRVDGLAAEIFLIADYVNSHFSSEDRAALLQRLEAHSALVAKLSFKELMGKNVQCPLLQNGRCSVYSVRPLACRAHHAQDFSACQYTFDHQDDFEFPGSIHPDLKVGLEMAKTSVIAAYATAGFEGTFYELGSALHEALTNPAAFRRWKKGKRPFLRSQVNPNSPSV
jgi:uncharacterized protein